MTIRYGMRDCNTDEELARQHPQRICRRMHADHRAKRAKVAKLASNGVLRHYVKERLTRTLTTPGQGCSRPGAPMEWS